MYQKGKDASHCYDYEKKWENWVPGAGETFIFLFLTSENVSAVKSSGYAPNQMGIKMKFFVLLFLFHGTDDVSDQRTHIEWWHNAS